MAQRAPCLALLGSLWLLSAAGSLAADPLAQGRTFSWSQAPNYARCTDASDVAQLTDGKRARNDYIWVDRASVGWELHVGDVVTWSMDLGGTCRLDSVVVSTAWFERSEIVPPALLCGVGSEPGRLAWAGALDAASLAQPDATHPARLRLVVPLRGVRGRWLFIAALFRSPFLCTDEIEVHGASLGAEASRLPAPDAVAAVAPDDVDPANPLGRAFAPGEIDAVVAVQRRAWAARRALVAESSTLPARSALQPRHGAGEGQPDAVRPLGLRPSMLSQPAVDEEQALFAARARAWQSAGLSARTVRRVDPWTATTPWSVPQPEVSDTLDLWPGAWSAAAIEIVSAGEDIFRVAVGTAPAPDGEVPADGAPRLVLREVLFVESRDGRWSGDALPLALDSVAVVPGSVRQVWIDVDARQALPGTYGLAIEVGESRVPLPVRVHDVATPAPALSALTWTYPTKFALTRAVAPTAVEDNREHGIDSWILAEESIPWPDPATIDAQGRLGSPLDFSACDRDLALLEGVPVRRLLWYWDFDPRADDPSRGRFRHPYGSKAWRRAVASWLEAWLAHLEARGFESSQVCMQPVDEAAGPAVEKLYRMLRRIRPDLQLALTLTRNATPGQLRGVEPYLTLAIVERRALQKNARWITGAGRRGIEMWTYDVPAPSKSTPPGTGYRQLPWLACALELRGCGFWSYGDTGLRSADAWNDFDGARWDFAVVYGDSGAPRPLGVERLVPSKRWQAFRMGMQEASLLAIVLRQRPELRPSFLVEGNELDLDAARRRLLRRLE